MGKVALGDPAPVLFGVELASDRGVRQTKLSSLRKRFATDDVVVVRPAPEGVESSDELVGVSGACDRGFDLAVMVCTLACRRICSLAGWPFGRIFAMSALRSSLRERGNDRLCVDSRHPRRLKRY